MAFFTKHQTLLAHLDQLDVLAETDIPVLLIGETGTGKELLAKRVHVRSPRQRGPFVPLNCAGLPESLLEAELFGTVKGSYTGSHQHTKGLIHEAHQGTLFLDEIGDMPYPLQSKLLRTLQEQAVRSVGSTKEIPISVRIVSATNQPLWEMVAAKTFRADLYFRLKGEVVVIPPLRDRPEDILPLAELLDTQYCGQLFATTPTIHFTQEVVMAMVRRSWPGNVRELQFALLRARKLAGPHQAIQLEHAQFGEPAQTSTVGTVWTDGTLDQIKRQTFLAAYDEMAGNVTQTAKRLGVSLRTARIWKHQAIEDGQLGAGTP